MGDLKNELASLRIDRGPRRAKRRTGALIVAALLIGGGAYAAWTYRDAFTPTLEVETARAQVSRPGDAPTRIPILTASGYIVARRKAVVSAKIQGRLSDLRVEEGSKVAEGDTIARLESPEYEAQVERGKAAAERADAELAEQKRQLRMAENLVKDGTVSADDADAARSRVRIAEAALRQAKADLGVMEAYLQNTFIRAPFAGVVIKKMAEVGESVAPIPPGVNVSTSSGAIVVLADMLSLEMEADVNESYIAKLRPENPAEVVVEAFTEKRYKAFLRQIIPSADRTKATVMVKVTILEKDEGLKPEMSARVTFLDEGKRPAAETAASAAASPPVITVPKGAVVSRDGATQVFEVAQGKVLARRVVIAGERGPDAVVKEGLGGNEVLVLNPPADLADGQRVKAK